MDSRKASERELASFSDFCFLDVSDLSDIESRKLYKILGVPLPKPEPAHSRDEAISGPAVDAERHISSDSPIQFMTESIIPLEELRAARQGFAPAPASSEVCPDPIEKRGVSLPPAPQGHPPLEAFAPIPCLSSVVVMSQNGVDAVSHCKAMPVPFLPAPTNRGPILVGMTPVPVGRDLTPDLAQFYQTQPPPNMMPPGQNVNAMTFVPGVPFGLPQAERFPFMPPRLPHGGPLTAPPHMRPPMVITPKADAQQHMVRHSAGVSFPAAGKAPYPVGPTMVSLPNLVNGGVSENCVGGGPPSRFMAAGDCRKSSPAKEFPVMVGRDVPVVGLPNGPPGVCVTVQSSVPPFPVGVRTGVVPGHATQSAFHPTQQQSASHVNAAPRQTAPTQQSASLVNAAPRQTAPHVAGALRQDTGPSVRGPSQTVVDVPAGVRQGVSPVLAPPSTTGVAPVVAPVSQSVNVPVASRQDVSPPAVPVTSRHAVCPVVVPVSKTVNAPTASRQGVTSAPPSTTVNAPTAPREAVSSFVNNPSKTIPTASKQGITTPVVSPVSQTVNVPTASRQGVSPSVAPVSKTVNVPTPSRQEVVNPAVARASAPTASAAGTAVEKMNSSSPATAVTSAPSIAPSSTATAPARTGRAVSSPHSSVHTPEVVVAPPAGFPALGDSSGHRSGGGFLNGVTPVKPIVSAVAPVKTGVSGVAPIKTSSVSAVAPVKTGVVSGVAPVKTAVNAVAPVKTAVNAVAPVQTGVSGVMTVSDSAAKTPSSAPSLPSSVPEKAKSEEPKPVGILNFAAAAKAPPSKMSYAFCVKGNNAPNTAIVIYKPETESDADKPSTAAATQDGKEKSMVVSVDKDSLSQKLGGFLSTYSVNHVGVPLIPRGMTNTSNWCFMNSTLQAMMSAPQVYHLLKNMADVMHGAQRHLSSTPICDSLVQFVNEFSRAGRQSNNRRGRNAEIVIGQAFDPAYIRNLLVSHSSFSKTYKNGRQEDAHEFFQYLVNGSHEEQALLIKHATGKTVAQPNGLPETTGNGTDNNQDDSSDGDGWLKVDSKGKAMEVNVNHVDTTPIKQIFGGVSVRSIFQQGKGERATQEHWNDFPVDSQCDNVQEGLSNEMKKETTQTDSGTVLTHQTKLEVLPSVLVLQYKTFQYDHTTGVSEKIIKEFKFDVDLTIPKELLTANARSKIPVSQRNYKLCAVVFHHGKKATGGHYTSVTYDLASQSWLQKDDGNVTVIPESKLLQYYVNNVTNQMPYMLFYRQRHPLPLNGSDAH